jgi:hypothetical protein
MAISAVSNGLKQVGFMLSTLHLKMKANLAFEKLWKTRRGISRLADDLLASPKGLCSMELVIWIRLAISSGLL